MKFWNSKLFHSFSIFSFDKHKCTLQCNNQLKMLGQNSFHSQEYLVRNDKINKLMCIFMVLMYGYNTWCNDFMYRFTKTLNWKDLQIVRTFVKKEIVKKMVGCMYVRLPPISSETARPIWLINLQTIITFWYLINRFSVGCLSVCLFNNSSDMADSIELIF